MPNRTRWNPDYNVGNEILDNQHRNLLEQCDALADLVSGSTPEGDLKFREAFNSLMTHAQEHFATEEALLTSHCYPMIEEQKHEYEEFGYLATDILTTENFEKSELQRFLTLWWVGHIIDAGRKYRSFLGK